MLWLFQRIGIGHGTIFPLYCITIAFEIARPRLEIVARPPQPPAQFALELDLKVRVLRPACQIGAGKLVFPLDETVAFAPIKVDSDYSDANSTGRRRTSNCGVYRRVSAASFSV